MSRYHTVGGLALYLNVFIRVVQALQKLLVLSRVALTGRLWMAEAASDFFLSSGGRSQAGSTAKRGGPRC